MRRGWKMITTTTQLSELRGARLPVNLRLLFLLGKGIPHVQTEVR